MEFDSDKNKKKYQCFVCANQYLDFEEFKNHIKNNHEEGREFVLCPLERCGAPVRDLRLHFKLRHKSEKMPKVPQTKAIIWKDFTSKGIKTRKPKFREGWYESTKMQKTFKYRSSYECTVFECLDQWDQIFGFEVEPFKIPYVHKGEHKNYIPDIFITFIDGHKEIWEIKPANQTLIEQNLNKWHAAENICEARGWKFVVIDEREINKLKKKVKG